jgi:hypothetical protein
MIFYEENNNNKILFNLLCKKTASNNQNQYQSGNYCCMSLLNCQMKQKFEFKVKNSHDHDYQSPNEMQASHYKIRFLGKVVKNWVKILTS